MFLGPKKDSFRTLPFLPDVRMSLVILGQGRRHSAKFFAIIFAAEIIIGV